MTRELILVADDSEANRLVAAGHLEAAGFEVVAAASGEQALELLATQRPAMVVLDVLMPGLGGLETCRRIRATPELAELPVLFLTALGDRDVTGPALDAGADDLLAKPFHRGELILRVQALIRHARVVRDLRARIAELERELASRPG
jgi:DNA-binding response OmpR family regulator